MHQGPKLRGNLLLLLALLGAACTPKTQHDTLRTQGAGALGSFQIIAPDAVAFEAAPVVAWTAADGAVAYNAAVGTPTCSDAPHTFTGVTATQQLLPPLAEGRYEVCVMAVDALGNMAAALNSPYAVTVRLTPPATLDGAPSEDSNQTHLAVTVAGTDVVKYKYKVGGASASFCADTGGYSAETPASTAISADITALADGPVTLCVVTADSEGRWLPFNLAVSSTWNKDTVAPAAAANLAVAEDNAALNLTWSPAPPAGGGYLVVRRATQAVSWTPQNGVRYTAGTVLNGSETIAFVGDGLQAVDAGLVNTTEYHYALFAFDKAANYSGAIQGSATPVFRFVELATGGGFTCGLTKAGKGYCWGRNIYGAIGIGATGDRSVPTPIDTSTISGVKTLKQIAVGVHHSCALTTEGKAYCWGYASGLLENGLGGASTDQFSPSPVSGGLTFAKLSLGNTFTCGLTEAGKIYCWGSDASYNLGNGPGLGSSAGPTELDTSTISGSKVFKQFALGQSQGCGLTTDDQVYCWGQDTYGNLGNGGTAANEESPTPLDMSTVSPGAVFTSLSGGSYSMCGVTSDGKGYCWGWDSAGQLGNGGASVDTQSPSLVDVTSIPGSQKFAQIAAGSQHSCGIMTDGKAYCWGTDADGQLGNGGTAVATQGPTAVDTSGLGGETTFRSIKDLFHTCALTTSGKAYCWGANDLGQLGDGGALVSHQSPVAVNVSGL